MSRVVNTSVFLTIKTTCSQSSGVGRIYGIIALIFRSWIGPVEVMTREKHTGVVCSCCFPTSYLNPGVIFFSLPLTNYLTFGD